MELITFMIICIFAWGLGQIFLKIAVTKSNYIFSYFLAGVCGIIVNAYYIIKNGLVLKSDPMIYVYSFAICIAWYFYYYTIRFEKLSIVGTIIASAPFSGVIFSRLLLNEQINLIGYISIFVIIIGIVFVSVDLKEKFSLSYLKKSWFIFAVLTSIALGYTDVLSKIVMNKTSASTFFFLVNIIQIVIGILVILLKKERMKMYDIKKSLPGTFCMAIGSLFFYICINMGKVSIVLPVASSYVIVTAIFSFYMLKEKLNKYNVAGIALVFAGLVLIGFN